MIDALAAHLYAADLISLRDVLRLILLSGLFTVAVIWAFPRNAPSRRILLLAAVAALTILPLVAANVIGEWVISVERLPSVTLSTHLPNAAVWIWLVVAAMLIARVGVQLFRELGALSDLQDVSLESVDVEVAQLCDLLDMQTPRVVLGERACASTLYGSVLVIPKGHERWSQDVLRSVLAHELVHIQRRDDRWLLLTRLLCLIYWWIPWLHVLQRGYLRAMEESCDDRASEVIGHKLTYVGALLDAAGIPIEDGGTAAAMHSHHLVGRIGRFNRERLLELDTGSLYWYVIGILSVVIAITSVEPKIEIERIVASSGAPLYVPPMSQQAAIDTSMAHQVSSFPVVSDTITWRDGMSAELLQRVRQPQYSPRVVYPGNAIRRSIEGSVSIEFSINEDGTVSRPAVVKSTPEGVFDRSALSAVRQTLYSSTHEQQRTAAFVYATNARQATPPPRVIRHFSFQLEQR